MCAATPVARADGEVQLEGPNVVNYIPDSPFLESSDELIQGTRTGPDGCEFEGETTATADTPSVGGEEVAFDPDTCRVIMRTGTLALDVEPPVAISARK